jgi:hypothetical protein
MRMIENFKLKSFGGGRISKKRLYKNKTSRTNGIRKYY